MFVTMSLLILSDNHGDADKVVTAEKIKMDSAVLLHVKTKDVPINTVETKTRGSDGKENG